MSDAWLPLALTLKVALWATAIDLVLGIALGWLLARKRFLGKELLDALLTLPMVLPPTVVGYYLLVLIGRQSAFGGWLFETFGLRLVFTWQGAVIAAALVALPFVVKPARAAFEGVDGRLEQAARSLGVHEASGRVTRRNTPASCTRPACSCASRCRWPGAASSPARCSRSRARSASSAPR